MISFSFENLKQDPPHIAPKSAMQATAWVEADLTCFLDGAVLFALEGFEVLELLHALGRWLETDRQTVFSYEPAHEESGVVLDIRRETDGYILRAWTPEEAKTPALKEAELVQPLLALIDEFRAETIRTLGIPKDIVQGPF